MSDKKYDLVIIGGGSAGLVAAVSAGASGAKTALVERDRIGGECSWTGCVPSKALIDYASKTKSFKEFINPPPNIGADTAHSPFDYVKNIREKASEASKVKSLLERYDVPILFGDPFFEDRHVLNIEGNKYRAKKIIISTGSYPKIPEGLEGKYLTNRNIWDLEKPPASMIILGGGPIGIEMAQSFARLGTSVNVVEKSDRILANDDREMADALLGLLKDEGITFHLKAKVHSIRLTEDFCLMDLGTQKIGAEKLLVAVGREANVEGLNLEGAGVEYRKEAIKADKYLRTSSAGIFAAGDCNGIYQFSHIAEIEAKTAVRNALFPLLAKMDYQGIPWATFTDPELAHLGLTEQECKKKGISYKVFKHPFAGDDRAIIEGRTKGMIKVISNIRGALIGVHILGPRAGELINEFVLARRKSLKIYDIGLTCHVYPSLGMAAQRATDEWFAYMAGKGVIKKMIRLLRHP